MSYCWISASDCDSKCTFDVDCPFPQVCNDEECVMDSNVLWECGGVFSDPRLACKKRLINGNFLIKTNFNSFSTFSVQRFV